MMTTNQSGRAVLETPSPMTPKELASMPQYHSSQNLPLQKIRTPQSIRELVFRRDGYHCCYCGVHQSEKTLSVDHIFPESGGGPSVLWNLLSCCTQCNSLKGALSLTEFLHDKQSRLRPMLSYQDYERLIDLLTAAADGAHEEAMRLASEANSRFGKAPSIHEPGAGKIGIAS
jgi:hypothetical protein